jgi:hypothetical protein
MSRPLMAIFICALALRLALALTHANYLGVDGGAYILNAHYVQGIEPNDHTGIGFPHPMLASGWLLVPFLELFGDDVGYKLWTALFSMAPVLMAYPLARLVLARWPSVVVTELIAFDPLHGEMMVTGSLPLLGFSLIAVAVWGISKLSDPREFQWRYVAAVALSLGILPHVNQTSAAIAVVTLPIYFVALSALQQDSSISIIVRIITAPWSNLPAFIGMAAGLLIALTALPWYLAVAPNNETLHFPGAWIYFADPWDAAWFFAF